MEFKKSIRSGFWLFCGVTVFICFCLGYVLPVGLDKVEHPDISLYFFSTYTVFTEFGMLIFSILSMYLITSDYREKNILFYRLMGYNWLRYFLEKMTVTLFWLSIPTIAGTILVSVLYGDFSYCLMILLNLEFVLLYMIAVTSLFGFLFKNLIVAYIFNLGFWLFSIFSSIGIEGLSILA